MGGGGGGGGGVCPQPVTFTQTMWKISMFHLLYVIHA